MTNLDEGDQHLNSGLPKYSQSSSAMHSASSSISFPVFDSNLLETKLSQHADPDASESHGDSFSSQRLTHLRAFSSSSDPAQSDEVSHTYPSTYEENNSNMTNHLVHGHIAAAAVDDSPCPQIGQRDDFCLISKFEAQHPSTYNVNQSIFAEGSPIQIKNERETKQDQNNLKFLNISRQCHSQPSSPAARLKTSNPTVFSGPVSVTDPPEPSPRNRRGNYQLFRTRSRGTRVSLDILEQDSWRRSASEYGFGEEMSAEEILEEEAAPDISAGRYLDALRGPELETPKVSSTLIVIFAAEIDSTV